MLINDRAFIKISLFYCCVTTLFFTLLVVILIWCKAHLLLGNVNIIPLFVLLVLFEVFKWCIHKIIYDKYDSIVRKTTFNVLYSSLHWKGIVRSLVITGISCFVYYGLAVLFGAELFNKQKETFMFSVLLTLLTTLSTSIQLGNIYVKTFVLQEQPSNVFNCLLFRNCQGALLGAWLGAFVIPLDWDRPWQVWPVPCSLGAMIVYGLSNCAYMIQLLVQQLGVTNKKFL